MAKGGKSDLEDTFALQLHLRGVLPSIREFKFHPTRRWRFDFAWPELMVAVEIQGGTFAGGAHGRGAGIGKSFEKLNAAAIRGWWVIQADAPMVRNCIAVEDLIAALGTPTRRHPEVAE